MSNTLTIKNSFISRYTFLILHSLMVSRSLQKIYSPIFNNMKCDTNCHEDFFVDYLCEFTPILCPKCVSNGTEKCLFCTCFMCKQSANRTGYFPFASGLCYNCGGRSEDYFRIEMGIRTIKLKKETRFKLIEKEIDKRHYYKKIIYKENNQKRQKPHKFHNSRKSHR